MFQGMHLTITGDSHVKKGIVCQDSSGVYVGDSFAIAVVAGLHLWKRQMLLSIAGGTVCYMLLVQLVF